MPKSHRFPISTLRAPIAEGEVHVVELCSACYRKIKLIGTAELAEEHENEVF